MINVRLCVWLGGHAAVCLLWLIGRVVVVVMMLYLRMCLSGQDDWL